MAAEAAADGDTMRMASANVLAASSASAEAGPAGAGKPLAGAVSIAALERFYRSIVRARDAKPPAAPHITGA
jgi:hypothetical protein